MGEPGERRNRDHGTAGGTGEAGYVVRVDLSPSVNYFVPRGTEWLR